MAGDVPWNSKRVAALPPEEAEALTEELAARLRLGLAAFRRVASDQPVLGPESGRVVFEAALSSATAGLTFAVEELHKVAHARLASPAPAAPPPAETAAAVAPASTGSPPARAQEGGPPRPAASAPAPGASGPSSEPAPKPAAALTANVRVWVKGHVPRSMEAPLEGLGMKRLPQADRDGLGPYEVTLPQAEAAEVATRLRERRIQHAMEVV